MKKRFMLVIGAAALAGTVHAQQFVASSDSFGYTGSITYYSTLADAESNTDGTSVGPFPQRDGALYLAVGQSNSANNGNEFLTNWYDSTDGQEDGIGNPNNTDNGFLQLYDAANATLSSASGGFSSDLNTFTLSASGQNATYGNSYARLWNAGQADVGGEGTRGTWLSYAYNFTATGLNGVDNGGIVTNTTNASSYSGSFTGLFQNLSVSSPQSDGFYAVNLTLNDTSWAVNNNVSDPDYFEAPTPSPEPAAMAAMWGSAAPFVFGAIRRRRAKASA